MVKNHTHVLTKVNLYTSILVFIIFMVIPNAIQVDTWINSLNIITQLAFYGMLFGLVRFVLDRYFVNGD